MDAFSHALETYIAKTSTPMTDIISIEAIKLISKNIRIAWADSENIVAREKLMYASMMAGIAINNADCGATHAVGEVIGGKYDLGHGLVIASFTPYVMEYNAPAVPEKMANIAKAMGINTEKMTIVDASDMALKLTIRLVTDLGIPRPSDLGIEKKELSNLSKLCVQNMSSQGNPRRMDEKEYLLFLEGCLSRNLW
jgi:1,3-propanediol dehydrogenase